MSRRKSIKQSIAQYLILFLSFCLIVIADSHAQESTFTLMGKKYRFYDGMWYTYFDGRVGDEIIPRRIIIRRHDKAEVKTSDFEQLNIRGVLVGSRRFLDGYYVISVDKAEDSMNVARRLQATGLFGSISFDARGQNSDTPNDPRYGPDQWNLKSNKINAEAAWNITKGSTDIILAIIDEGPSFGHEDLVDNIWQNLGEDADGDGRTIEFSGGQWVLDPGDLNNIDDDGNLYVDDLIGWDFESDDNLPPVESHGTRVAGVAMARSNNSLGVAGVSGRWTTDSGVRFMALHDTDANGFPTVAFMCQAIDYAIDNGANVINISQVFSADHDEIEAAINRAAVSDVVVVCSSGNFAGDNRPDSLKVMLWPARYSNAISVGATTESDVRWVELAEGSMVGDEDGAFVTPSVSLDVMAPGAANPSTIWTTQSDGGYSTIGKTSAAAPHVSGVAALILSINPNLSYTLVGNIIRNTADKVAAMNGQNYTDEYGFGRINAHAAVLKALDFLPDRTSNLETATAHNSGRHIVRDGSGNYHIVYQAGNQVFYANYSSTGSWSSDVRLSDGLGQYNYPSIAERSNNLYVTWQKKTGSTSSPNHDIYFHKSTDGGTNWSGQVVDTNVGSSDPLPVIASPSASNLDIAYRAGGNIRTRHSATDGASWSTFAITGTTLNSPSVAPGKTPWNANTTVLAYATNDIPNASDIKAQYYYNGWTSEKNLSSGLPSNFSQHARPSIAYSGDYTQNKTHVAWDAYNSFRGARVILHKVMSTWGNPSAPTLNFTLSNKNYPA